MSEERTDSLRIGTPDDSPLPAARLAYAGPLNEQPGLAERKAMVLAATGGLVLTTTGFFAPSLTAVARSGGPASAVGVGLALGALLVLVLAAGWWSYRAYALP